MSLLYYSRGNDPVVPQMILRARAIEGTLIANWRVVFVAPPRMLYTESLIWTGVSAAVTSLGFCGVCAVTCGKKKSLIAPIEP